MEPPTQNKQLTDNNLGGFTMQQISTTGDKTQTPELTNLLDRKAAAAPAQKTTRSFMSATATMDGANQEASQSKKVLGKIEKHSVLLRKMKRQNLLEERRKEIREAKMLQTMTHQTQSENNNQNAAPKGSEENNRTDATASSMVIEENDAPSLEDIRNVNDQIEKIVRNIQINANQPKLTLAQVIQQVRELGLITEDKFQSPNTQLSLQDQTSHETYERLFKVDEFVSKQFEPELNDTQNLMTLISTANTDVKFFGVICLRMTIFKFGMMLQGDFYHNAGFINAIVQCMVSDPNALIQKEFLNICCAILKTQRGHTIYILVKEAYFPTSLVVVITQSAQKIHQQESSSDNSNDNTRQKIIETYVEIISTAIWSAALLAQEPDSDYTINLLQANYVSKLMDAVTQIGQEVFTQYFEDLASMYTYALNSIVTTDCDALMLDQSAFYQELEKAIPFLMNVLAHIILSRDESEGPLNQEWISPNTPDYFCFDLAIDMMEVLQTMEALFGISEGQAQSQFYDHPHCHTILSTVIKSFQNTVKMLPIADQKPPKERDANYELYYIQIQQVNEWFHQLFQSPEPEHHTKLMEYGVFEIWTESLQTIVDATTNNFTKTALHSTLQVITELVSNDITYSILFENPKLLDLLINGFVLRPKKVFHDLVIMELASTLRNLCAIDELRFFETLIMAGLPNAVMTILARFMDKGVYVANTCLEALLNLFNVGYQEDKTLQMVRDQLQLFNHEGQNAYDILQYYCSHDNEEINEMAEEVMMYIFDSCNYNEEEFVLEERIDNDPSMREEILAETATAADQNLASNCPSNVFPFGFNAANNPLNNAQSTANSGSSSSMAHTTTDQNKSSAAKTSKPPFVFNI